MNGCTPGALPPPPAISPSGSAADVERRRRRFRNRSPRTTIAINASPPMTPPTMGPIFDLDLDFVEVGALQERQSIRERDTLCRRFKEDSRSGGGWRPGTTESHQPKITKKKKEGAARTTALQCSRPL
jgi:hypothetical protein